MNLLVILRVFLISLINLFLIFIEFIKGFAFIFIFMVGNGILLMIVIFLVNLILLLRN